MPGIRGHGLGALGFRAYCFWPQAAPVESNLCYVSKAEYVGVRAQVLAVIRL